MKGCVPVLCLLTGIFAAGAQVAPYLEGTVVDEFGRPIAGASVLPTASGTWS